MAGVHSGHRKRLRDRARREKLKAFQPHEVLELILMQIIPLRDVNPLAHCLIDRFGSVEAVLRAPVEELVQVEGIGRRSAEWLAAMGEMAMAYSECWHAPSEIVTSSAQAIAYIERRAKGRIGDFALVCMDRSGRVLHDVALDIGPDGFPRPREMVRLAMLHHAAQVFSVHHAFSTELDAAEIEFTKRISEIFSLVEIVHLDHIVAARGCYFSARREGMIGHTAVTEAIAAEKE